MDKGVNINEMSILQEIKNKLDNCNRMKQMLENELNNLEEDMGILSHQLVTKKKRFQFYETNYQKLQQQIDKYTQKQSNANITYSINEAMINKVKIEQEKYHLGTMKTEEHSNKKQKQYENEKEDLIKKKKLLSGLINKNNALMKDYIKRRLF